MQLARDIHKIFCATGSIFATLKSKPCRIMLFVKMVFCDGEYEISEHVAALCLVVWHGVCALGV